MAGPVDEEFALFEIEVGAVRARHASKVASVLEFGCSPGAFTSRAVRRLADIPIVVTGIDLYPAEVTDGYEFVQADVVEWEPGRTFETIVCVSSFEHCGIESRDFQGERRPDLLNHLRVAEKLQALLAPGGRLIVTCPFGPDEVWFTREGGEDFRLGEAPLDGPDVRWGYRTFSLPLLSGCFPRLRLAHAEAHAHRGGDYFDRANWAVVDPATPAPYDNPYRRAVLCAVFEKGG